VSKLATRAILTLTVIIVSAFVTFTILRRRQLSLPDPYNNPCTNWSTAFLLVVPFAWLFDLVLLLANRRRVEKGVAILAWIVVAAAGLFITFICAAALIS
jgi:hypothetical protein